MREMQGNWRDIFMAFRVALDPKKLLLCFVGIALSFFLTVAVLGMVASEVDPKLALFGSAGEGIVWKGEAVVHHETLANGLPYAELTWEHQGFGGWFWVSLRTLYQGDPRVWALFTLVMLILHSLIWSYFGGAVTRIAALQVTKDESLELDRALKYAHRKYSSYFWSVGACVAGFLFFFLFVSLVAWPGALGLGIGRFLSIFLMLGYPLAVLAGFLMTLIAIGTVFGTPLFYPAISAEGTDAFDAISRGYGYVYSKPWHFIFYQLVSLGHAVVSVGFVWLFGWLMLTFTDAAGFSMGETFRHISHTFSVGPTAGMKEEAIPLSMHFVSFAGWIYTFWYSIICGMLLGYGMSYFLSAQTIVYFLLRKKVDGIEVNEVYEEKDELPASLPPEAPKAAAPAPTGAPSAVTAPVAPPPTSAAPAAPPAPTAPAPPASPPSTGGGA